MRRPSGARARGRRERWQQHFHKWNQTIANRYYQGRIFKGAPQVQNDDKVVLRGELRNAGVSNDKLFPKKTAHLLTNKVRVPTNAGRPLISRRRRLEVENHPGIATEPPRITKGSRQVSISHSSQLIRHFFFLFLFRFYVLSLRCYHTSHLLGILLSKYPRTICQRISPSHTALYSKILGKNAPISASLEY